MSKPKLKNYCVVQTIRVEMIIKAKDEGEAMHKMSDKASMYATLPDNEPKYKEALDNAVEDWDAYEIKV